ncbi:riboflavin synthase alpha chain [Mesonia algae]|uniref:Riboflavin synthase n=1 Tax=Mesonia algae TaxID=213248 RepID=A0A2W7IB59_9FLAO|nr:riboflavin synthase [Mesonia algae]PZW44146.1 riboflavin synthase alpha chain [Mesonia algae]
MFTGIVEVLGKIINLTQEDDNIHFTVESSFAEELKIDQSVAHNGVCLTVTSIENKNYTVTAIRETLDKTNLSSLSIGDMVNLERGMMMNARLDGHIVQGHVDQTATCTQIQEQNGSHIFTFSYDSTLNNVTIEKGSITVNGVSLTVINSKRNSFSVAIIPYTYEHTTFKYLKEGATVNLEFDVIGKYVQRLLNLRS